MDESSPLLSNPIAGWGTYSVFGDVAVLPIVSFSEQSDLSGIATRYSDVKR
jgi:hypothetical protein